MDSIDAGLIALAVSVGFFVNGAVDIVKRIAGRSRHRRWLLPISGAVFGWTFVGLLLIYRKATFDASTVAGAILAGFLAALMAAYQNDQSKAAERPTEVDGRG
jgi:hypothetical protein